MVNAIVGCFVVLALAALYFLARSPDAHPESSRRPPRGRICRLLRIAVRRSAHRYEQWPL